MDLSFTWTKELRDRCVTAFTRGKIVLPVWLLALAVWALIAVALAWLLSRATVSAPLRWTAAGAAAAVILWLFRARLPRKSTSDELLDRTVHARFTDDGMESRIGDAETVLPWSSFIRVAEVDGFLFLHTAESSAQVVPTSAFKTPEDLAAFRDLLARKVPPPPPRQGLPILGRTRPVYYLLFLVVIVLLISRGRAMLDQTPKIVEADFVAMKSLIREVRIRKNELRVQPVDGYVMDGRTYHEVRLMILTSPENLARLLGGLPPGTVVDER